MERTANSYCSPSLHFDYSSVNAPIDLDSLQKYPSLSEIFTQHDLLLANAMGMVPWLQRYLMLNQDTPVRDEIASLKIRQQILHRVSLVSVGIESLAAELDCEGERVDQLGAYLDNINNRKIRKLIVASVIVGAVTTIATSYFTGSANKGIAIGGGALGAVLSGLTINPKGKKLHFAHTRNLLKEIWNEKDSGKYYPPYIWYILNEKKFSNSGKVTLRESIRERWSSFELKGDNGEKENLMFGDGGVYNAEDLHLRAALLNQLQSTIRSINQDLASLTLALEKLK